MTTKSAIDSTDPYFLAPRDELSNKPLRATGQILSTTICTVDHHTTLIDVRNDFFKCKNDETLRIFDEMRVYVFSRF